MNGFDYQTTCLFIEKFRGITINLQTLKRRLADYGVNKTEIELSDASLRVIIETKVSGPSSLKWHRNNGITFVRHTV